MHVCVQGSRLDSGTHTHTHIEIQRLVRVHEHALMISSSLGRCISATQGEGDIIFLFLRKCGDMDIMFVLMLLFHLLSHGIAIFFFTLRPT